jgi:pimeloyl-[acyl-carrier protein] methyl ester esterase
MPTAWLAGVRDTLVPIAALQHLTRDHPHMQLIPFEQAGHAPFISHSQAFAHAVMEFLQ